MKKLVLFILGLAFQPLFSQVGIGTNNPDTSAILDLYTSNKGLLLPRVALQSSNDNTTIATPATGLTVYNTGTAAMDEGTYTNLGTAAAPIWMQTSPSKITPETLNYPGSLYIDQNAGEDVLFDRTTLTLTPRMLRFNSFLPGATTKDHLTLPKDGLYCLLIRPAFSIDFVTIGNVTGTYFEVQYNIYKNGSSSPFDTSSITINTVDGAFGSPFTTNWFGGINAIYISGKAGDTFSIVEKIKLLADNGRTQTIRILGGNNSGYSSIGILQTDNPNSFLK